MAEEKGLLATAMEAVKMININGNGAHDKETSSASGSATSEKANGQDSHGQSAGSKATVAAESSESAQIQRVVCSAHFSEQLSSCRRCIP